MARVETVEKIYNEGGEGRVHFFVTHNGRWLMVMKAVIKLVNFPLHCSLQQTRIET